MTPSKKDIKLTPGEAELLGLFWENGPLTLSQTHEIYTSGTGSPALQTIQTRLNRMVAKKLLRREGNFPAVYSSMIEKDKTKGVYFDLIDELAGKDFAPIMMHLCEKRSLSVEEIDALEKIVAKQRQKIQNRKGRKS